MFQAGAYRLHGATTINHHLKRRKDYDENNRT